MLKESSDNSSGGCDEKLPQPDKVVVAVVARKYRKEYLRGKCPQIAKAQFRWHFLRRNLFATVSERVQEKEDNWTQLFGVGKDYVTRGHGWFGLFIGFFESPVLLGRPKYIFWSNPLFNTFRLRLQYDGISKEYRWAFLICAEY